MFGLEKDFATRACVFISTVHVLADVGVTIPAVAPCLEAVPYLELALLLLASGALVLHLTIERALFDWLVASAHGCNLLAGWATAIQHWSASVEWLPHDEAIRFAALTLAAACTASLVEVLGLRHAARRRNLFLVALMLVLSATTPRNGIQNAVVPPRATYTRIELVDRVV